MDRREVPPPRHDTSRLAKHPQRDKHFRGSPRTEASFSSSTYVDNVQKNPHTSVQSYKFKHYKNEVELVINMEIATEAGCRFWLRAQGAIMTEGVVPAAAVIAIRRLAPRSEHGRQMRPEGTTRFA
eukprot:557593-Pyramimonas_sp.AAC.1